MKAFFFLLLAANVLLGAWMLLGEPVDSVREPGRMQLQIEPGRFRVLSDADLARLRGQAERNAAAAVAAAPVPKADVAAAERPSVTCVEIGNFPSESAAKKARARLAAIGLADRTSASTVNHAMRLRVSGIDAATEAKIDEILKDYPKQQLEHCTEVSSAQ
ncbi:exported hypothetical protein [Burkholderiales bacterium]|nr:exported hypothetical protein [Burkholderiales bacterium]